MLEDSEDLWFAVGPNLATVILSKLRIFQNDTEVGTLYLNNRASETRQLTKGEISSTEMQEVLEVFEGGSCSVKDHNYDQKTEL